MSEMKKYMVIVEETLSKELIIEAENEIAAEQVVEALYYNSAFILDYHDFAPGSQEILVTDEDVSDRIADYKQSEVEARYDERYGEVDDGFGDR